MSAGRHRCDHLTLSRTGGGAGHRSLPSVSRLNLFKSTSSIRSCLTLIRSNNGKVISLQSQKSGQTKFSLLVVMMPAEIFLRLLWYVQYIQWYILNLTIGSD